LATSFLAAKRTALAIALVYGSAATNSTPSLAELATIHSTVYSPRVPIGDGLRSIDGRRSERKATANKYSQVKQV
jgi:hypothetical protein